MFRSTLDRWRGVTVTGNDVYTTINAKAQKVALDALAGQCGAAVALNPRTGATLVMASSPTYNPNLVEKDFVKIGLTKAPCSGAAPLLNRATQGLFTPGSTFKIITAAAALDTGAFTPDSSSTTRATAPSTASRSTTRATPTRTGPRRSAGSTLQEGFQHSVNSVFCNIGKKIGAGDDPPLREALRLLLRAAVRHAAERAGAERALPGLVALRPAPTRTPPSIRAASPSARSGCSRRRCRWRWSPATVATGGIVMRPYVVSQIVAPNGSVVYSDEARPARPRDQAEDRQGRSTR